MKNEKIFNSIDELIGNTPLLKFKIPEICAHEIKAKEIVMKLECFNPLSSVKDRISKSMIEDALAKGILSDGKELIEPTSGNTGVGLAFICAAKKIKLTLVMPETMSIERRKLMGAFGANLVLTPGGEGMKGAINKATELLNSDSKYVMLQQFNNPANPKIHRETTAKEIWDDTNGDIDVFVSGVGTGGTITGVGEFLKNKNKNIKIFAVEPSDSPVLSGGKPGPHKIQGIGAGFVPNILNKDVIDEIIQVTSEKAGQAVNMLATSQGVLVGISSGAALWAAIQIAKREEFKGKRIVVMMPDSGERYLSTWLFEK